MNPPVFLLLYVYLHLNVGIEPGEEAPWLQTV